MAGRCWKQSHPRPTMKKRFLIPLAAFAAFGLAKSISNQILESDIKSCNAGNTPACIKLVKRAPLPYMEPVDISDRIINRVYTEAKAEAEIRKIEVTADAEPEIKLDRTSYEGQLMTDYKAGKVLGEIKCGKRPVREGMDLLNVNGVPAALLENFTPEMQHGFNSVANSWGCNS